MTDHPITPPPPELVQQWLSEFYGSPTVPVESNLHIANLAAQWGADHELDACCDWIPKATPWDAEQLRTARRPKPPSLKEQALRAAHIEVDPQCKNGSLIIRALEALPDD